MLIASSRPVRLNHNGSHLRSSWSAEFRHTTGTAELGYPTSVISALGVVQLVCLALYLVPRTAPFGALLWTGYLGGAIATHVRVESPLFSHVMFPIYVAAFLWLGLWLRDARVRGLFARRT